MSSLSEYLNEVGDLPEDVLLGRIVVFTISDEPVDREDVARWFKELGLHESLVPAQIKTIDAFKKATSDAKGSYDLSGDRVAFTLCRDVTATTDYVRRQITREVKDSKRKSLSYDAAIECTFHRVREGNPKSSRLDLRIQWQALHSEEHDAIRHLARQIERDYVQYATKLDGNKLRAVVRNYIKGPLNAIEIKGGVYFVHAKHDAELASLSTLVDRFGGDCRMNMIPMVNIERERKFIAERFEREASSALSEITKEAKEIAASGRRITPGVYAKMKERFDDLIAKANEHTMILELSQDMTAASAEVAEQALLRLQEQMLQEAS